MGIGEACLLPSRARTRAGELALAGEGGLAGEEAINGWREPA